MNMHPFDTLPLESGGRVIFTPCPGTKGVALTDALAQLRQAGAQALITLMPTDELAEYGVSELPRECDRQGMRWLHMPIEDDAAPTADFEKAWRICREEIHQLLDRGGSLAIHCKGGSGRTGLMAGIILAERGLDPQQVGERVRQLRPKSLRLPAHVDYLHSHAALVSDGHI